MSEIAGIIAIAVLAGLTIFQIALILGAPIGHFAWGGQHRVLPVNLRIGSVTTIFIYTVFATIILQKSGLADFGFANAWGDIGIWVLTGYFTLGIGMNAISRSNQERLLMTPIAALLALSCLLVALS